MCQDDERLLTAKFPLELGGRGVVETEVFRMDGKDLSN